MLFIRHAAADIDTAVSAREWQLSVRGRFLAQKLAPQIASHSPTRIIASTEKKAVETGQILAEALGIPWQTAPNLHEHERTGVGYFESREDFLAAVANFFANPDELVFGEETANQALERFDAAVHALITQNPTDTLAIVSHGTVISLFLAYYNNFPPFPFWQKIMLPDFYVVTTPGMTLVK